jgi:hypothetical protein
MVTLYEVFEFVGLGCCQCQPGGRCRELLPQKKESVLLQSSKHIVHSVRPVFVVQLVGRARQQVLCDKLAVSTHQA